MAKNCTFENDCKPLAGSARELSSFSCNSTFISHFSAAEHTYLSTLHITLPTHKITKVHNVIITIQLLLSEWHPQKGLLPKCFVSFYYMWRPLFIWGIQYLYTCVLQGSLIELHSLHRATFTVHSVINEKILAEKVPALRWLIYGCMWGWQQCSPAEWW